MNKEEYLEKYSALNKKFNEYKNKMVKLQNEYISKNAEYQVGDIITARYKDSYNSKTKEYVCSKVIVKLDGELVYRFKSVGSSLFSFMLEDLTDIQKK